MSSKRQTKAVVESSLPLPKEEPGALIFLHYLLSGIRFAPAQAPGIEFRGFLCEGGRRSFRDCPVEI